MTIWSVGGCKRRSLSATYFCPTLEPPFAYMTETTIRMVAFQVLHVSLIKIHQKVENYQEVENVKSLWTTDGRRRAMIKPHLNLRLRWAKKGWKWKKLVEMYKIFLNLKNIFLTGMAFVKTADFGSFPPVTIVCVDSLATATGRTGFASSLLALFWESWRANISWSKV